MSKKEELIKRIAEYILDSAFDERDADIFAKQLYDEICASILTPKVMTLLKAIGSKPNSCNLYQFRRNCLDIQKDCYRCNIDYHEAGCKDALHYNCPLLSSEELKELIE